MNPNTSNKTSISWLFKMAWRDSRKSRKKLLLFISSIIAGIAALVAISSFSENLQSAVDEQSKELLGADLSINSRSKQSDYAPDSTEGIFTDEVSFASMVYFPKGGGTRLVNVKAIGKGFPFYGKFETKPLGMGDVFRNEKSVLVDNTLLSQFNARPGDSIRIGEVTFLIKGNLEKVPGQNQVFSSVAPPVYIPIQYLEATGLLQKGSRYTWRRYVQLFNLPTDPELKVEELDRMEDEIEEAYKDHRVETVEDRKRNVGRIFTNLSTFLNLTGFMALLLGCVGVASSVNLYTKSKLSSVAILRCLGVSGKQAFSIFLIQIGTMGFIGAVIGAILGNGLQWLLPEIFQSFLPIDVRIRFSWSANLIGVLTGLLISLLFALIPLSKVRKISPLRTLRASFEEDTSSKDNLPNIIYLGIIVFVFGFTAFQMNDWKDALVFTGSVIAAFALLAATASLLIFILKKFFPYSWSYLWRQGLANLFRPNNQTTTLMVSVGLGTALISTLLLTQSMLLDEVSISGDGGRSNMVLFDIQSKDLDNVKEITNEYGLPILQEVPIVTMRLDNLNGITMKKTEEDSTKRRYRWAFRREFRVTYRDSLISSEKVLKGKWKGSIDTPNEPIYVSVEEGMANNLRVDLGDTLTFNVQGMLIETLVGQVRTVDWARVQTNFTILFPTGVLEKAPQFHVLMTRTDTDKQSGAFQKALVENHPNVSVIDLALILSTLDEVLSQISFVIQFMSLFSIITGFVVLIGSVTISKYQRIQESVILRTLGGNKKQILLINTIEYALLGSLATFTGVLLALVGSWGLAIFSFEVAFTPPIISLLLIWIIVTIVTIAIGLFNSREVLRRPPLEVLRLEIG